MLPKENRLTKPADFRRTIRAGRAARASTVVVHGLEGSDPRQLPRIGVTVSKAVGGSVARHKVARIIRHAMAAARADLPTGSRWVIRALPPAGEVGASARIRDDVRAGIDEILGKST